MIKKYIIAVTAIVVTCFQLYAQRQKTTDANITGHVVDTENGEHLPACLVKIVGTNNATLTDASGHYVFRDLRPGEYSLEASMIGYSAVKKTVKVNASQTVEVNFDITPDAFMLDQVVVTSSKSETARRSSMWSPPTSSAASGPARLPTALTSSRGCALRTIARTVVLPRYASTVSTAITPRYL